MNESIQSTSGSGAHVRHAAPAHSRNSNGGCPYGFVNPFGVVCWWRFRARFALCPVPSVLVLRDVG